MPKIFICILCISMYSATVHAEPYLAVRTGLNCSACHSNPTGGGKRNEYGNIFAQKNLAIRAPETGGDSSPPWNGTINKYFSVGADFRGEFVSVDAPGQSGVSEFVHDRSTIYLEFKPIPNRLSLYFDEKLGPGGSFQREAYGLYWLKNNSFYVKAGQFFLPYGLRIEDDGAFIRSITGINFNTPDNGVEVGLESKNWSAQLAISNGGAVGQQDDKQRVSSNVVYSQPKWRFGASFSMNETNAAERDMYGLYGGVNTGPISWLLEYDRIKDGAPLLPDVEQAVSLVEGNWLIKPGHNLKLSYELHDPNIDISNDDRDRTSLIWEHFPMPYLQFSLGVRDTEELNTSNSTETAFAQLHVFF